MRNTANNRSDIDNKFTKRVYNLRVEKLVREANDNFVYFRDYEKALEQINEALAIEPTHTKALILKGDILFCIDMDNEALEYFDRAIQADPYSAEAYGSKAGALDVLGNQKEALLSCQQAFKNLTIKDRHLLPSLYDQNIALLIKLKKFEEARLVLKRSLKRLQEEDRSYLISCYQEFVEKSCKEQKRKREQLEKISLKLVY